MNEICRKKQIEKLNRKQIVNYQTEEMLLFIKFILMGWRIHFGYINIFKVKRKVKRKQTYYMKRLTYGKC